MLGARSGQNGGMKRIAPAALVALLAAVVVAGCGDDDDKPATNQDTRSTSTTPTTSTSPAEECSASGLEIELPAGTDLPEPVERTRMSLFADATSCDFDALAETAAENPDFGFAPGAGDPAAYWRSVDAEQRIMERIARLLTTPSVEKDEGGVYYAWPSVYEDTPSAADYDDLVASGAYTKAEAAAFQRDGSYYGLRIAIKPDGAWHFLTSGG